MPLRGFLKKKERVEQNDALDPHAARNVQTGNVPEFTFMRSDTHTQEIISPPTFAEHPKSPTTSEGPHEPKLRHTLFKGRSKSVSGEPDSSAKLKEKDRPVGARRLSQRLGLTREESSSNVPQNLPEIRVADEEGKEGAESQWEQRATILARENEKHRSRPVTPIGSPAKDTNHLGRLSFERSGDDTADIRVVSTKIVDDNIQEAIRLHEAGELETSTKMFGRLANPNGENNALSQVLYGLALRHGWGCTPNPTEAVTYLSAAASNAAAVEDLALQAGLKKGGAAKGELVLAIFELANCFRHGWGVQIDKVAAKQYYETAANLGDTDAMNEVAWCYVEGFGCKKDKFLAAKYYRLAEAGGSKTLGNTWIWKEKYNAPKQ